MSRLRTRVTAARHGRLDNSQRVEKITEKYITAVNGCPRITCVCDAAGGAAGWPRRCKRRAMQQRQRQQAQTTGMVEVRSTAAPCDCDATHATRCIRGGRVVVVTGHRCRLAGSTVSQCGDDDDDDDGDGGDDDVDDAIAGSSHVGTAISCATAAAAAANGDPA